MRVMFHARRRINQSRLQPEHRALRSIQAPQQVTDENGVWRVSSAAFSASGADASCSVDLEPLLHWDGLATEALYPGVERSVGLVALPLSVVRQEGGEVAHDPVKENWYHGAMTGDAVRKPKAKKRLAAAAEVVIQIDQASCAAYHRARSASTVQS